MTPETRERLFRRFKDYFGDVDDVDRVVNDLLDIVSREIDISDAVLIMYKEFSRMKNFV